MLSPKKRTISWYNLYLARTSINDAQDKLEYLLSEESSSVYEAALRISKRKWFSFLYLQFFSPKISYTSAKVALPGIVNLIWMLTLVIG